MGFDSERPIAPDGSLAGWLEAGLDAAAFLFLPILVLAPRGLAALAAIAGAMAAGLVLARRSAVFPSPPVRGEREGPIAQRWGGEVGASASEASEVLNPGSGPGQALTPALSAPGGGEGEGCEASAPSHRHSRESGNPCPARRHPVLDPRGAGESATRPDAILACAFALLAALAAWGLVSALWSVEPWRSVSLALRLSGMFAAALALAAASRALAAPRRLMLFFLLGLALGVALAGIEFVSHGALIAPLLTRRFRLPALNHASLALAFLLLPAAASLSGQRRPALAAVVSAAIIATVFALVGAAAKIALLASLPIAALVFARRRAACRIAAGLAALVIVTAPLTFPRLAGIPAVVAATDAWGGHLEDSGLHRLLIWSFSGDRIAERPFLGWGLDSSRNIPGGKDEIRPAQNWMPLHPHNAALQAWLELGVPGAALTALLAALLWLGIAAAPWPRLYAAAAAGSLSSAFVASLGTYGLWQEWWLGTLALALFLILVLARAAEPAPAAERAARSAVEFAE